MQLNNLLRGKFRIYFYSAFFALLMWIYLNLNLVYTVNLSIPLEIQFPKTQAITGEIPSNIDITLQGKGWDIINVMLSNKLKYTVDYSKNKKDSKILTSQLVNERLNIPPNITILKIFPDTIHLDFEKLVEKIVKIRNNTKVNLKEGYQIVGEPIIEPDSVKIIGAASFINKIKSLSTEYKEFDDINSDFVVDIKVKDTLQNLIKIDPQVLNISYKVELSAEKNFDNVEIKILNLPTDKEVLLIPPNINLSLRGGVNQLAEINNESINVSVDYSQIENDTLGYIIPKFEIPFDVTIINYVPQKIQYIVKRKL